MTAFIYKAFLFFWKINPFKKATLDLLKKTKHIKNPKITSNLYLNNQFEVSFENVSFYLYNDKYDKSSFDIYLNGIEHGWDRTSIRIWKDLCEKAVTIFDVGTNIGLYCLTATKSNPSATVYGFEPSNNSYQKLLKNIEINKSPILHEKLALSDQVGQATFYDSSIHTAVSSLKLNSNLQSDNLISYQVDVTTFDNYVQDNKIETVDLISIDVEELEESVLKGMQGTLAKHAPTLLVEVLNDASGEKIQAILDRFHYQYFFINEDGFLNVTNALNARPSNYIHSYNVLAIARKDIYQNFVSKWKEKII